MKNTYFLILLFLLSSCGKIKLQEIYSSSSTKNTNTISIQNDSAKYSEIIDVMVAFLWPLKIENQSQQIKLEEVIAHSRELVSSKEKYLSTKFKLQELFTANQCPCAINNECSGNETDMDATKCYEIEDAIYKNDSSVIDIFGLVETIKKNVKEIGGEWLDTHLDLKNVASSTIKLSSMDIYFTALGSYEDNNITKPFSYLIQAIPVIQESGYKRMTFSMPRLFFQDGQTVARGNWTVDVGLMENQSSLLFQGELSWSYQGSKRRGVIYWENPKK